VVTQQAASVRELTRLLDEGRTTLRTAERQLHTARVRLARIHDQAARVAAQMDTPEGTPDDRPDDD
jgi:uncharacterized membrane protein